MALVIFCVALIEAMRTRMSLSEAIAQFALAIRSAIRLSSPVRQPVLRRSVVQAMTASQANVLAKSSTTPSAWRRCRRRDRGCRGSSLRMSTCLPRSSDSRPSSNARTLADRQRVEIAVDAGIDHHDLLFHLQRRELRLLQQLGQARAAVQQALGEASRSEPNCAKAAISRYCASSPLILPATFFIALVCADEPTRDTDRPTFTAGRMPW